MHIAGFLIGGGAAPPRRCARIGAANLAACALLIAAGYARASGAWPLWLAAVVVQMDVAAAVPFGHARSHIDVEHFAERHGLMIIIVLGESLVSVAVAAQSIARQRSRSSSASLCGLAASAAHVVVLLRRRRRARDAPFRGRLGLAARATSRWSATTCRTCS